MPDDDLLPTETPEPTDATDSSPETEPAALAGTPEATIPPESADDVWTDPAKVPDPLKPLAKRFQASYTKRMQKLAQSQADLDLLTRFRSDPEYARGVLAQEAQRLGLTFGPAASPQGGTAQGLTPAPAPSPAAVARAEAVLPAELRWLAPAIASAAEALQAPRDAEAAKREATAREAEYDDLVREFGEKVPGWEGHEDEMVELLGFLQSPALRSRKFGSKLDLLYALVTRNAAGVAEAGRRMRDAVKGQTKAGASARSATPNFADRVRGAKTSRDAFALAVQQAEAELTGG